MMNEYKNSIKRVKKLLDIVEHKLSKREDPIIIEKILIGIDTILLKIYNMDLEQSKKDEIIKLHGINVACFKILALAKSFGWEIFSDEIKDKWKI